MQKIAISDIHGCNDTFQRLLEKLALTAGDELYLLGDYIDRGPDSKGVLDTIFLLQQQGLAIHCLKGNHEQMMLDAMDGVEDDAMDHWLVNGGITTLESFLVNGKLIVEDKYLQFLSNLEFYYEVDEYILVHAGLNFKVPLPLSEEISMLWIRDWYHNLNRNWLGDRIIIHGHTPIPKEEIQNQFKNLEKLPVLNIDGGCVHKGKRRGVGYLCAFDMTDRKLYFQDNMEQ
jgi:serine/threonine protein phosphatase 1